MKVCIVTLYKSCNSGSFLQAYALKKYMEQQGNEVLFLKINYPFSTWIEEKLIKYTKKLLCHGLKEFKNYHNSIKRFKKLQKELNVIGYNKAIKNIDVFIFGSDTIWDIDREKLFKLRDVYFGINLKKKKKIAYAASFANTKYEKVIKHSDIIQGIKDFYSISVRDDSSSRIVAKITNKEPLLVCDPTILLKKEDYNVFIKNGESKKYIFAYLFEDLNDTQKNDLRMFAQQNDLEIYGVGNFNWYDKNISNFPDSFLNGIFNAQYVITDTFHGTIFSTIFNKNYIVVDRNKNKVNEFLHKCCLDDRLVSNNELSKVFNNEINYDEVNNIVDEFREKSIKYLDNTTNE